MRAFVSLKYEVKREALLLDRSMYDLPEPCTAFWHREAVNLLRWITVRLSFKGGLRAAFSIKMINRCRFLVVHDFSGQSTRAGQSTRGC